MEILNQRGIQHVCGMNSSYQQYYLIYLVNANILYYFLNKKGSNILLKSTKYNRRKLQKCLELLSRTVDDILKITTKFNLSISQENLNE